MSRSYIMTLPEYEEFFRKRVRMYGAKDIQYLSGKLMIEAGEVHDYICKIIRDDFERAVGPDEMQAYIMTRDVLRERIATELGDTLWYLIRITNLLGYNLQDILAMEAEKIVGRQERDTDHGSGDDR
jgi:NTP pyrophosphatase (non-canonical NTP hydrolase)